MNQKERDEFEVTACAMLHEKQRSDLLDALKGVNAILKSEVSALKVERDALLKLTPCPKCGKKALFVCSLGALNCAECADTVSWLALSEGA